MLLLYSRPMRSSEVAALLGKSVRVVSSYLSYWKSRGYVAYRSGYWYLTRAGEEHVSMLLSSLQAPVLGPQEVVVLAQNLIRERVLPTINSSNTLKRRQGAAEIQSFVVDETGSFVGKRDLLTLGGRAEVLGCLEKILEAKNLSEDEASVLRHLVKHYVEWSSTYLYLDQLADELHYHASELVEVLKKLQAKKLVYLYADRRFGIRVGLGRSLKLLLDQCLGAKRR